MKSGDTLIHVPNLNKEELDSLPASGKHSTGQKEYPAMVHKPPRNVNLLTMIIRKNHYQNPDGELEFFNYHRYGEIFVLPCENVPEATLTREGGNVDEFRDYLDYRSHFFEGGYFPSMEAIREKYPGTKFMFNIKYKDGREMSHIINLKYALEPPAVRFTLYQDNEEVSPVGIDPKKDLTVMWSQFSEGVSDSNGIMDDLALVRLDTCEGERKLQYISGVPTLNGEYLTFNDKEVVVPAGTLRPKSWFWCTGEFSKMVETSMFDGAPVIASYMTATYLATRTIGGSDEAPCMEFFNRLRERGRYWKS